MPTWRIMAVMLGLIALAGCGSGVSRSEMDEAIQQSREATIAEFNDIFAVLEGRLNAKSEQAMQEYHEYALDNYKRHLSWSTDTFSKVLDEKIVEFGAGAPWRDDAICDLDVRYVAQYTAIAGLLLYLDGNEAWTDLEDVWDALIDLPSEEFFNERAVACVVEDGQLSPRY